MYYRPSFKFTKKIGSEVKKWFKIRTIWVFVVVFWNYVLELECDLQIPENIT